MPNLSLDIRNLQIKFMEENQNKIAVDQISFQVPLGKTVGIVGESGSGKSITSLGIMGLLPNSAKITRGEIWFYPENEEQPVNLLTLNEGAKRDYRGGKIAMIFQEPMSSLNPVYNIGFQIEEAIILHRQVSKSEARRQASALLQEVRLLPSDEELQEEYITRFYPENVDLVPSDRQINQYINQRKHDLLNRYPHQLSGGQLQRVMIAMAISCNPQVLIADEPTTALDVTVQATILKLLRDLCKARNMSMIFISHDLGVIAEMVDAVVVMYRGKIVESGPIAAVLSQPQHPYTKGLLACRPPLAEKLDRLPTLEDFLDTEGKNPRATPQVISITEQEERLTKLLNNEALIKVKDLCVGFPQTEMLGLKKSYMMAVNHVSFDLYRGETLGLVGESGCGKSTLARAILRLIPVLQGEIKFQGEDITKLGLRNEGLRRLRREMQIVFQNPYSSLNPRMTVGKAIMEPMMIHGLKETTSPRERVKYLLERVGLSADAIHRYPHEFSGGQRQRICIARALAVNPKFIICDESVSALDVSVQAQVLNLLKELQEEFDLSYIFISHDLSVVKFISDRIMVMNKGKIEEIGSAEQIYRAPTKAYTQELINSIPAASLTI